MEATEEILDCRTTPHSRKSPHPHFFFSCLPNSTPANSLPGLSITRHLLSWLATWEEKKRKEKLMVAEVNKLRNKDWICLICLVSLFNLSLSLSPFLPPSLSLPPLSLSSLFFPLSFLYPGRLLGGEGSGRVKKLLSRPSRHPRPLWLASRDIWWKKGWEERGLYKGGRVGDLLQSSPISSPRLTREADAHFFRPERNSEDPIKASFSFLCRGERTVWFLRPDVVVEWSYLSGARFAFA